MRGGGRGYGQTGANRRRLVMKVWKGRCYRGKGEREWVKW